MLKTIIATLILLSGAGLASAEEPYYTSHAREVVYSSHEGWTATSDFFCWSGSTPIHEISEIVTIPRDHDIIVEFFSDTDILNCLQDVILPSGEKVIMHRINVLH